jgi:ribonuclease P protein component
VLKLNKARSLTRFTRSEIKSLISQSKVILRSEGLHIKVAPRKYDFSRILIVISRKVGKAVIRNRIRRRIRHIFMTNHLAQLDNDVLVYVQPMAANYTYQQLEHDLLTALKHKH